MALETVDVFVSPDDGWVLVADTPSYLYIKPSVFLPWDVAIAATTPASTFRGIPMGRDPSHRLEPYENTTSVADNVYVRVRDNPSQFAGGEFHFGVIRNNA